MQQRRQLNHEAITPNACLKSTSGLPYTTYMIKTVPSTLIGKSVANDDSDLIDYVLIC